MSSEATTYWAIPIEILPSKKSETNTSTTYLFFMKLDNIPDLQNTDFHFFFLIF
jgi:hypothetical protein